MPNPPATLYQPCEPATPGRWWSPLSRIDQSPDSVQDASTVPRMRPDQVGPARRNTRAPSLLRTCATDRALELGLGHRRAALDLQPLSLVVELLLRPIATARGRAARPSARATARS